MAQYSYNPDWASAIASIESEGSGGYSAIGAPNSRGSRAYGRYQVMDFNIPEWTERYTGKRLTPEEFLNSPEAQDAVFQGQFGSLVQRYGNERDAASAWFTGRPISTAGSDTDVHGRYTGASYADAFQKALGNPNVINAGIGSDALVALGKAPAAGQSQPGVLAAGAKPMAMMDTQPQGLLERMGLQRMNPEGQGETAMPFYQRPSFLDFAKGLGLGLSQLSTRPSQAAAQQLAQLQQDRSQRRSANQTLAWLASQPGGEMYVQMLQAGANPAAVLQAYMQAMTSQAAAARGEVVNINGVDMLRMPDGSFKPIDMPEGMQTPLTEEQFNRAGVLRDDLWRTAGQSATELASGYNRIMTFYDNPGSVSDYALAVAFAKILDPGSVAREGEVQAVRNAGAKIPALAAEFTNMLDGKGSLTPETRRQIADLASKSYGTEAARLQAEIDRVMALGERYNIPADLIWTGGAFPEAREIPGPSDVRTQSAIEAQVTPEAWSVMTPEEKALFP